MMSIKMLTILTSFFLFLFDILNKTVNTYIAFFSKFHFTKHSSRCTAKDNYRRENTKKVEQTKERGA